jgi:hypothetical protein
MDGEKFFTWKRWTVELDRENPGMVLWERRFQRNWDAGELLADAIEGWLRANQVRLEVANGPVR